MSGVDKASLALLIDALKKIGKSTDAAGLSSLFAQLAQIREYTDTLETVAGQIKAKSDLIGATNDSVNVASIFGKLAALQYGLNNDVIGNRLGNTGDAAALNGSIFSRLAYIIANIKGTTVSVASDVVQYSDATERSSPYSNGSTGTIVHKFIPFYSGEIRVVVDIRNQEGSASELYAVAGLWGSYTSQAVSDCDWTMPIGTTISPFGNNDPLLFSRQNSVYTTVVKTLVVKEKVPTYLVLKSRGSNAFIRNLSLRYTLVQGG
ncbi:hypothetical protein [Cohnella boryungensis]|uniref:Tail fiber protein n=1 Tax=Cohnella boryungensis TaxID=768479 RepID=A0ABV8SFH0_9BACL